MDPNLVEALIRRHVNGQRLLQHEKWKKAAEAALRFFCHGEPPSDNDAATTDTWSQVADLYRSITSEGGWIASNGGDTSTLKTEQFKLEKGDVVEIEGEGIHREVSGVMGKNENGWFAYFVKGKYGNIPHPGQIRWRLVRASQAAVKPTPPLPAKQRLFISYRREDSEDIVGRIFDRLAAHFGRDNVFMDVDTIPLGVDFRTHISEAVSKCDVIVAVIGKQWLDASHEGQRRLDDPRDFVRIEIQTGLDREIPVIPVIVRGAEFPREQQLPDVLKPLAFRHAAVVRSGTDFDDHMTRLIRGIEGVTRQPPILAEPEEAPAGEERKRKELTLRVLQRHGMVCEGTEIEPMPDALPDEAPNQDPSLFRAHLENLESQRCVIWEHDGTAYSLTKLSIMLEEYGLQWVRKKTFELWRVVGQEESMWDQAERLRSSEEE